MAPKPTTVDTDTELSAVNAILGSIGQSPVAQIDHENPEISFIYNILTEVNKDVQGEGWAFNVERGITETPDSNKNILVANNVLSIDSYPPEDRTLDLVIRNGKLYDKVDHTDEFSVDVKVTKVWLWEYEELPSVFKRYIVHKASARAAIQLVSNPQLVQMLATQEALSRASCLEYECNQGDYSYFGTPQDTHYVSYKPYHSLARR